MANEKELKEEKIFSVINRGQRSYRLKPFIEKDASGKEISRKERILGKGQAIKCLDEAEYKALTRYHDVVDADKVVPHMAADNKKLQMEISRLSAENQMLKETVNKLEEKLTDPKPKPK